MSMQHYAVDDYGLLFDEETIRLIASKLFDDYSEDDNINDLMYELYDNGFCEYISEFTGESQQLEDDGLCHYNGEEEYYWSDVVCYCSVSYYPTLFKMAYRNMDEIVDEFKNKLGEYLPDDFDYRSHICRICGTYYG